MDRDFFIEELKKYLRILYNFIDYELNNNNNYYSDLDLYNVSYLYENLDKLKNERSCMEIKQIDCQDCFYNDFKNVCLNINSKYFMCKTDYSIVKKSEKNCFRQKEA